MEQQSNGQSSSQQSGQTANSGTESSAAGAAAGSANWVDGFEPDLKSYVQKKGFTDPKSIADSYRNLEKLAGGDRASLVRLPDDLGSDEMTSIWERLGRPKEAKDYTFQVPEDLKGIIPESDLNQTREFFLKNNMTRKQAEGFMKMYFDHLQGQVKTQTETYQSKISEDTKALEKAWGHAHKENQNTLTNTLKKLEVNEAEWKGLQNSLGVKRASELFYQIGKGSKEDTFHGGSGGGSNNTPDSAKTEIALLKRDRDFVKRLTSGDVDAKKRWDKLHQDASPGEMAI